jgi:hypothetical protein
MMKFVAMTLAALLLAGVLLAQAATGQPPQKQTGMRAPACNAPGEVSLYFERDSAVLNPFSIALVDRVADEAKSCGLAQVTAETRIDRARGEAISRAFQSRGVKLILTGPKLAAPPAGNDISARAAKLRLDMTQKGVG